MTFSPVVPPVFLIAIAAAAIVLRLITMRQLAHSASQRWATVWRWSALTLAVMLMLIAAARPAIGGDGSETAQTTPTDDATANVFLIVDRSSDSAVTDHGPGQPRIAGIRDDITALIDRYPQARFALITFAARSSLEWPLSKDNWSLKPVVAAVNPYPDTAVGEVNAAAAANILRYQLIAAGQRDPDAQNLVFYFGSGAPASQAPQGEFDPVTGSVDGGAVFGYGATRNDQGLQRIADQLGVPFVGRDTAQPVTDAAPDVGAGSSAQSAAATPERTDLYWVFSLVAAVLLLFEIYLTLREVRTSRAARREEVL
ncbi:VWA domain-containing protein [Mycolicibacterium sp. GF69]|uniref:vWA domain-containing protein n=1 Tax=Mycolicibacterium sp. GF69 TaxID=2267251 RepID=UPI000DCE7951|nr:vWA domain-containing protein [Mycolicibacterium sp. GF69]RAV17928.1 VWA domain-containing protein [Mycolicibacterium sp. GF69]